MSATSIIRFLHVSDLHFDDTEGWERRAILQAMERHLGEIGPLDLLLVSGDIANHGRRAEYDHAQQFLTRLATTLQIDLATRCFVVPGNHDVDRGRITRASAALLTGLEDEAAIGEVMADPEAMRLLGARLSEFYGFTARLLGTARGWSPERPWRVDEIELCGIRLALLQLNSAWASGTHEDRGRLLVGEYQIRAALDECAQATLRLVLLHHPVEELRDEDRDRVGGLLMAPGGADILLRGHLHAVRSEHVVSPDATCVQLAAGAAYTHDRWPKTFHVVELDLGRAEVRVRAFRYSDRGRGFWAPDTASYERARDGIWSHPLPALTRVRDADLAQARQTSNQRNLARWREASAAVYGTQRFIGLADRSPKPNVRVEAVFVPLRIADIRKTGSRGRSWQTSRLIPLLGDPSRRGPRRIVILGDPGSGKTLLCRYLAVALSGGLPDVHPMPAETLTLLLPFRDYVTAIAEAKSDISIIEYLVRIATTHLAVRTTVEELERQLESGNTVLLLDGLDEVGEPERRALMRDRVLAFCSRYLRVAVLATSRFAGYDEAPLPVSGAHAFRRFGLQPLSLPEIDEFVERWYLAQEPDDAVTRQTGETELKAALRAEPAALGLARNPLLLTLIALIHRSEARLPGERAKLFEKCVVTMLETWPAVRKREFRGLTLTAQRACLEGVAWFMQHRRVDAHLSSSQLVLAREQLRDVACQVLTEGGFVAAALETPRLVEAWLDHLARETGLLVELAPGRFGFLHLALMEYLAACQLDRETGDIFAQGRWGGHRSAWQEVRLLHVGRHAEDPRFLAELSERSIEDLQWEFLLRCIREEACLSRAVVELVLDELFLAVAMPSDVLADVLRFSRRHADCAAAWLTRRLASDRAIKLQRAVRIAHEAGFPGTRIVATLTQRTDADDAALAILGGFWPAEASTGETDFVRWAWTCLSLSAGLQWASGLVERDVSAAALLAHVVGGGSVRAAVAARLTELALDVNRIVAARRASEHDLEIVPGAHVVCAGVRGVAGTARLRPCERQRLGREQILGGDAVAEFVRSSPDTAALVRGYAGGEWLGLAECPGWQFLAYFADVATAEHVRASDPGFYDDWNAAMAPEVEHVSTDIDDESDDESDAEYLPGNYSPEKFVVEGLEDTIRKEFSKTPSAMRSPERPDSPQRGHFDLATQLKRGDILWVDALLQAMAIHTGVALVASRLAALDPPHAFVELEELMSVRAWTLVNWDWIDAQMPAAPGPAELALYLALGWTQCSSSGHWPPSSRWRELLAGGPPAHWLPRVQWYLCLLTYDPTAAEFRQGLGDALTRGVDDPEFAPIATFLRERLSES